MKSLLLSTTSSLDGWEVVEYLGPVSAQIVIGTGMFTDFFSGITDFFGTHSRSYQDKLDRIDREAHTIMSEKAARLRANAIIGMRVDHDEISGNGKSMLMVTASGTAVSIRRIQRPSASVDPVSGAVTSREYKDIRDREALVKKATDKQIDFDNTTMWQRVLEVPDVEVGKYLLEKIEAQIAERGHPDLIQGLISKFKDLAGALPFDEAKELLYLGLHGPKKLGDAALSMIARIEGFDAPLMSRHLAIAQSSQAKGRIISVTKCDAPLYRATDIPALSALYDQIPGAFTRAQDQEDKGMLGKKLVWECVNEHKVKSEDEYCYKCETSRWGTDKGDSLPQAAMGTIKYKIEVIQRVTATA